MSLLGRSPEKAGNSPPLEEIQSLTLDEGASSAIVLYRNSYVLMVSVQ